MSSTSASHETAKRGEKCPYRRFALPKAYGTDPSSYFPNSFRSRILGLFVGGYIIISGAYSPGTETTAGGIVGMIFGYWLR
jgi:hypothetical protein